MMINLKTLDMAADMGAALSLISESRRKAIFPHEKLRPAYIILETYTNDLIEVLGTLNICVHHEVQLKQLILVVIAGERPRFLGCNWLNHITLN